jgi:SAM-dependent methyltransferase
VLDRLARRALAPLSQALGDHARGELDAALTVHVAGFPDQHLPAAYFFRGAAEMDAVDRAALELARGRILDVGAGAGAHSVPLVEAGFEVTAIEILPELVEILRGRGVKRARRASVWTFPARRPFDTVLALMNGTSLAGILARMEPLLTGLGELVAPDGQILIDSTEMDPAELDYQLEYRGQKGPPFPQLFVGERALEREARKSGWKMKVVARESSRYLARLIGQRA